jgi:hypothetical protein
VGKHRWAAGHRRPGGTAVERRSPAVVWPGRGGGSAGKVVGRPCDTARMLVR